MQSTDLADRSNVGDKEVDVTQVAANEQKKAKKEKVKQAPKEKQAQVKKKLDDVALIGITAKKEEDLAAWYQEILLKGDFLEYSDIPGCYIINVRRSVGYTHSSLTDHHDSPPRTPSGNKYAISLMSGSKA